MRNTLAATALAGALAVGGVALVSDTPTETRQQTAVDRLFEREPEEIKTLIENRVKDGTWTRAQVRDVLRERIENDQLTVREAMFLVDGKERQRMKSIMMQRQARVGTYTSDDGYRIAVQRVERDDHMVVVFARAFKDGQQVGFGSDGTVDIERFRFRNPPILVQDPNGTIKQTNIIDPDTGSTSVTTYREDPREALQQMLSDAVRLTAKPGDNIERGKVGNTVTTIYPDANPETTSMDGCVAYDPNSGISWSTTQTATAGNSAVDTGTTAACAIGTGTGKRGNGNWRIERSITGFDLSDVGSDTITDITVSLYGNFIENDVATANDDLFPVSASPASNTGIATTDFNDIGDSVGAPTYWATGIDISSLSTSGYNDFTGNSTFLAAANAVSGGVLNVGWRTGDDVTAEPSGFSGGQRNRFIYYTADQAGTTNDPKLVVTHEAGGGGGGDPVVIPPAVIFQ